MKKIFVIGLIVLILAAAAAVVLFTPFGQNLLLSPEERAFRDLSQETEGFFNTTNHLPLRPNAEELIRMNPDKPDGYFWRGVAATGEGNFIDAEKDLEKAVLLDPEFPMAQDYLTWVKDVKDLAHPQGVPVP